VLLTDEPQSYLELVIEEFSARNIATRLPDLGDVDLQKCKGCIYLSYMAPFDATLTILLLGIKVDSLPGAAFQCMTWI
jgi:hypothetical protein